MVNKRIHFNNTLFKDIPIWSHSEAMDLSSAAVFT